MKMIMISIFKMNLKHNNTVMEDPSINMRMTTLMIKRISQNMAMRRSIMIMENISRILNMIKVT